MKQMRKINWKIVAIIFIVLFVVETLFWIWSTAIYNSELDKNNECLYDICGDYVDAWYEEDICTCYEYDMTGDLIVAKNKYMK